MAAKIKVTYNDGREVEVVVSPRAQVMTERKYSGIKESQGVEQAYHLAWQTLFLAGKEAANFESFLDLIADAEPVEKADGTDPMSDGPPSGESST